VLEERDAEHKLKLLTERGFSGALISSDDDSSALEESANVVLYLFVAHAGA
jgi:hypothetical protein